MKGLFAGATAGALCLAAALSAAQAVPVFELVSVRRSLMSAGPLATTPGTRPRIVVLPGGRFEARGQTLVDLARVAFGFEDVDPARGMVQAGAAWLWDDRFDVTATADHRWTTPLPGSNTPAELRPMLRALLEEWFGLKARIETRPVEVTALRLAKQGVPDVPGLGPSTAVCLGPTSNASPGEPSKPPCRVTLTKDGLQAEAVTMAEAAQLIARIQGLFANRGDPTRPIVVDQTALPGKYDLSLKIPSTEAQTRTLRGDVGAEVRSAAVKGAIEAQLGLKLVGTRAPIPTLIVERARKPQVD